MNVVDTNVWIYIHDHRDPLKNQQAIALIARVRPNLLLPWQVGCEFLAASRKLQPLGFTNDQAWRALEQMRIAAQKVVMPEPRDWSAARDLQQQDMLSFWDALLMATCIRAGVTTVYTEDFGSPRIIRGVNVVNPFA
jgi:predicted nucleic acid-binding protein